MVSWSSGPLVPWSWGSPTPSALFFSRAAGKRRGTASIRKKNILLVVLHDVRYVLGPQGLGPLCCRSLWGSSGVMSRNFTRPWEFGRTAWSKACLFDSFRALGAMQTFCANLEELSRDTVQNSAKFACEEVRRETCQRHWYLSSASAASKA